MAYCVIADVIRYFPEVVGSTFDLKVEGITNSDVTNTFIPECDALIDSRLRSVTAVPVTLAADLVTMRLISSMLAAQRVWDILFSRKTAIGDPNVPNESDWGKWGGAAERMLTALATDKMNLGSAMYPVFVFTTESKPISTVAMVF